MYPATSMANKRGTKNATQSLQMLTMQYIENVDQPLLWRGILSPVVEPYNHIKQSGVNA